MDIRRHHQRLLTLLIFSTLVHGSVVWLSLEGVTNKRGVENTTQLKVILVQAPKPKPTQVPPLVKPIPAPKSILTQKVKAKPTQANPEAKPTTKFEPIFEAVEPSSTVQEAPVLGKPDPIVMVPVFKAPQPLATNPKPHYPLAARRRGLQGEVMLILKIDERGHVMHVSIQRSSGYLVLDRAAKQSVSRWRFTPALSDDKAVTANVEVPIMFDLN